MLLYILKEKRILFQEHSIKWFYVSPLHYKLKSFCCVFRPVNGCSPHCLLVRNHLFQCLNVGPLFTCFLVIFCTFLSFCFLFSVCDGKNKMRRFQIPTVRGNGWKFPFSKQSRKKERDNDNGHNIVLTLKKFILTSERCAEHLFAGRNTQQVV